MRHHGVGEAVLFHPQPWAHLGRSSCALRVASFFNAPENPRMRRDDCDVLKPQPSNSEAALARLGSNRNGTSPGVLHDRPVPTGKVRIAARGHRIDFPLAVLRLNQAGVRSMCVVLPVRRPVSPSPRGQFGLDARKKYQPLFNSMEAAFTPEGKMLARKDSYLSLGCILLARMMWASPATLGWPGIIVLGFSPRRSLAEGRLWADRRDEAERVVLTIQ